MHNGPTPRFGRAIRQEWLLEPGMDFLNHGSFGATPRRVLKAQDAWRTKMERQPLRFFLDIAPEAVRAAADDLARFLGSTGEHLAFVDNATSGTNAVLRSFPFEAGDEILCTDHGYGAVVRTIEYVARQRGATPVHVELPFPSGGPEEVIGRVRDALTDRTRMAVLDHVTSSTALVLPIAELVELCQGRGIPVLVDGAHGPGMLDLQLDALGADWYTGNCHKWLCSAKGCAFLWTNPESSVARSDLHPPVISHFLDQEWPAEFDFVGTRDYSPWLSVTEALAFRRELGAEKVESYIHDLVIEAGQFVASSWGVALDFRPEMTGSILTLPLPISLPGSPEAAIELNTSLWEEHRIEVPPVPFDDKLWIRISAQVYNELEDYQRLAAAFPSR